MQRKPARKQKHWSRYIFCESKQQEKGRVDRRKVQLT